VPAGGARARRGQPGTPPLAPIGRRAVARLTALGALALIAGCGSSASHSPSGRELALERAQLVQVSDGLRSAEGAVKREVAASRGAWPQIAWGLPQALPGALQRAVSTAATSAQALPEPGFMTDASKLTGPAAGIAGLYENYERLAERGWKLTETTIHAIVSATPAVASFERGNSSLYIDAIYDAHFDLSLVGKSLTSAYQQLGGTRAFGARLTQSDVGALAATYSIPGVRLAPHPTGAAKEG